MARTVECDYLDHQTKCISIERELPGPYSTNSQYVTRWGLELFGVLSPVTQPLSASLRLRGRRGDWPVLEHYFEPGDYTDRIRATQWPSHVLTPPTIDEARKEHTVSTVTDREFGRWILEQVEKTPTPDGYVAEIENVTVTHRRARLSSTCDVEVENLLLFRRDRQLASIPVEVAADGLWVSGPAPDSAGYELNGPIELDIWNHDVTLQATLDIRWSLWAEPGNEAYELLMGCLRQAVGLGWEVTSTRGPFEIATSGGGG